MPNSRQPSGSVTPCFHEREGYADTHTNTGAPAFTCTWTHKRTRAHTRSHAASVQVIALDSHWQHCTGVASSCQRTTSSFLKMLSFLKHCLESGSTAPCHHVVVPERRRSIDLCAVMGRSTHIVWSSYLDTEHLRDHLLLLRACAMLLPGHWEFFGACGTCLSFAFCPCCTLSENLVWLANCFCPYETGNVYVYYALANFEALLSAYNDLLGSWEDLAKVLVPCWAPPR